MTLPLLLSNERVNCNFFCNSRCLEGAEGGGFCIRVKRRGKDL